MKQVAEHIHGCRYGPSAVASSAVSLKELEDLKISAGFTAEDERYLRLAGSVLGDQTRQIVMHWRSGIIAGIPNLARTLELQKASRIPTISRRAICALSNGSSIPVYGPMTRSG